jgi:hypothetical protein
MATCLTQPHRWPRNLGELLQKRIQIWIQTNTQSNPCVACNTQQKQRISTRHNNNIEVKACLTIVVWCI